MENFSSYRAHKEMLRRRRDVNCNSPTFLIKKITRWAENYRTSAL